MPKLDVTRRQFLRGLTALGVVGVAATAAYATLVEPYAYELTETIIHIHGLPPGFEGFRIAQVSDVHHGRLVSLEEVQRVVQLTRGAQADLIVLTGDYTTSRRHYIEPCAEVLGELQAPDGVWAVLGNHDHRTDPELTTRSLTQAHINVLNNQNTLLRRGSDVLQLAGIDDWSYNRTDWKSAFDGLDPQHPIVLLSHQPCVFDMPQTEKVALVLAGHTHGGQVCLPIVGAPVRFMNEFHYVRGLYRRGQTQLYVSRGTGVIGLPIRFGAPPEISVLQLRRTPEEATS
ncbi:MAG: metallophosphoesterase [Pyrinomonadaceae bacterium]|nr:metallophosphoesterase [Pyrinomonadaceae bacterium]